MQGILPDAMKDAKLYRKPLPQSAYSLSVSHFPDLKADKHGIRPTPSIGLAY